jgi:dihydrofolate reductase
VGNVIAFTNVTLDGVMQSPGRPDEDPRNGFTHGGWAAPYGAMAESGEALANMGALLLGRWTWENFAGYFPKHPENPFSAYLGNIPKYVASRTLKEPLGWTNSSLLSGDAAKTVSRLKDDEPKDLVIFGSGILIQGLLQAGVLDRLVLLVHPLVLGSGHKLFAESGGLASLRLKEARTTARGVVISTYLTAGQ